MSNPERRWQAQDAYAAEMRLKADQAYTSDDHPGILGNDTDPAKVAFLEGLTDYTNALKPYPEIAATMRDLTPEQKRAMSAIKYVTGTILTGSLQPTHRMTAMDRIQNANLLLARTAQTFNEDKGVSFVGFVANFQPVLYGKKYEKGTSMDIHYGDLIRVPENHNGYYRIRRYLESQSFRQGFPARLTDIPPDIKLSDKEIANYKAHAVRHIPYEEATSKIEAIPGVGYEPDAYETYVGSLRDNKLIVEDMPMLQGLDDRSVDIIIQHYGLDGDEPRTLEEIAMQYGFTRTYAWQIQNTAFEKIRKAINEGGINQEERVGTKPDTVQSEKPNDDRVTESGQRFKTACSNLTELLRKLQGKAKDEYVEQIQTTNGLSEILNQLSERQAFALTTMYGLNGQAPMKPRHIAAEFDVDARTLTYDTRSALKKLRNTPDIEKVIREG